jgi:hypothetical protein
MLNLTLTQATHFTAAIIEADGVRTQPAVMGNGATKKKQLHNACPTYIFPGSNPESICIPDLKVTSRLCEGSQHAARIPPLPVRYELDCKYCYK